MLVDNFEQSITHHTAGNLCSYVHQVHPTPCVWVEEVPTFWNMNNLDFVPFYIVQSIFLELEDKVEVVKNIGFRNCLEGIGGEVVESWGLVVCDFGYSIHKFLPCLNFF